MVAERQDLLAGSLPDAAYRALVEAAPDIVAVFHGDGRIRYVNATTTAVLGYAPEEWQAIDAAAAQVKRAPWMTNRSRILPNYEKGDRQLTLIEKAEDSGNDQIQIGRQ